MALPHTQLLRTPSLSSHNFVTLHLSHTALPHTLFVAHHHSQTGLSHATFRTELRTTTVSHTIFHTHLFHTHLFHTHLCSTPSATQHLSQTSFIHQLCHTPSFTHHLCLTPSVTHTHTPLSDTIFHTHNFHLSHTIFVTHHLSHATLSHTLSQTTL